MTPVSLVRWVQKQVPYKRLILGIDYSINGPVHQVVERHGELTAFDYLSLRLYCLLGLSNEKLEQKLRAYGYAFLREARLLESIPTVS